MGIQNHKNIVLSSSPQDCVNWPSQRQKGANFRDSNLRAILRTDCHDLKFWFPPFTKVLETLRLFWKWISKRLRSFRNPFLNHFGHTRGLLWPFFDPFSRIFLKIQCDSQRFLKPVLTSLSRVWKWFSQPFTKVWPDFGLWRTGLFPNLFKFSLIKRAGRIRTFELSKFLE